MTAWNHAEEILETEEELPFGKYRARYKKCIRKVGCA